MKREPLTQIVLVIVGLFNLALIYFLYMDLRHSSWLLERKNEIEPKFLSFFIPIGVLLLIAARRPSEHRSMIALANLSLGVVFYEWTSRAVPGSMSQTSPNKLFVFMILASRFLKTSTLR